jgi:hypothetical protein
MVKIRIAGKGNYRGWIFRTIRDSTCAVTWEVSIPAATQVQVYLMYVDLQVYTDHSWQIHDCDW